VRIPGDKSISHATPCWRDAEGTSRFHNFSAARDCASTLDCVAKLGCEWSARTTQTEPLKSGIGPRLKAPTETLDCGNSGSPCAC